MNKIERMLQEFCPNGVEYKKLGDVCEIKGRIGFRGYTRKDLVSENEGAISLSPSNIENGCLHFDHCSYVSWAKYNESPEIMANIGDVVFTKTASVGKTALIKNLPKETTINPQLVLLKNITCNSAYLAYVLQDNKFQSEVQKITGVGSVPNVSQSALQGIEIPVPPLPIQEEIVRILDHFTELAASLQAELQAELQARKEQYEYYRNKLLTFDNIGRETQSVTWMKMSEIGDFYSGLSGKSKSDFENGNSKYATYMNVYKNLSLNIHTNDMVKIAKGEKQNTIQQGDVLFTGSSETPDECGMSSVVTEEISEPIYLNSFCFGFRPYDKSLFFPDFLKHLLRSKAMRAEITKTANGVTRFNVSKKLMGKILLPIPPYKEQKRLATILDKFETLVNDLSQGLPAEIAAVQEQYEYYRDKLLTFKRIA